MSVDLVSTSETNVTVSLDPAANTLDGELLGKLQRDLSKLCGVRSSGPAPRCRWSAATSAPSCTSSAMPSRCSRSRRSTCVSQAANDLNFTFVVDENQGDRLVEQLHDLLIRPLPGDLVLGPTWEQLFAKPEAVAARAQPWWARKRDALLGDAGAARQRLRLRPRAGRSGARSPSTGIKSIGRALYALKANPHPEILRTAGGGRAWASIACRWPRSSTCCKSVPGITPERILFTPNFAPRAEYERALALGVHVTIDNLFVLQHWLDAFRGKSVFLRIDTGIGRGHHHHVKTAGARVQVRHSGRRTRRSRAPREVGRRDVRRPARACRQRRVRRRELDPGGLGAGRPGEALPGREVHRRRRRPRRAGSHRRPRARSRASSTRRWRR